ncbi:isocitrate lyase/PEP mutase family protein [Parasphingopyxis algicola]|uniref:isocitrate lyase/PEP mutase family protein n=1 Tax=Parasphingopyxis algicola TaxID=2026624 RepID=UPI0015A1B02D|nr:isocitrate lyase/PEP mutase family protein [Parasphingopyxis algicola]QLC26391.1 isocitrate lyase/PEP mutase family protein [Parasphingopyxis algicola]
MTTASLRSAIEKKRFVTAPGVHDMIAAKLADLVGFDFVYASGFWQVASAYGLPDVGIATYTEMLARISLLAKNSKAAIIADADTGYGGLLNVHHTVQGYEAAGVRGIQIEDQTFPKKCGHTPNVRVVPCDEMVEKIQVACAARTDPAETLIIARTDAIQTEGLSKAIGRAQAYADAGADILFVEALESEEDMRTACSEIAKPMLANMADGGRTPILPAAQLEEIGFSAAIFPAMVALAASAAMKQALTTLKSTGTSQSDSLELLDFNEFQQFIGFPDVWALEEKWAAVHGEPSDG